MPETPTLHTSFDPLGARVVLALNRRDRDLFFGSLEEDALSGFQWLEETDRLDPAQWAERLREMSPEIVVTGWSTPPLPVCWIGEETCSLRYVCHLAGSVRRLVPRLFLERGGIVTNWGDAAGPLVAEQALLLALAALRNQGEWESYMALPLEERPSSSIHCRTRSLFGCRVGIHGFGSVARSLLKLLAPFNVKVSAYSSGVPEQMMRAEGVRPCATLGELFAASDVLFECEALTEATMGSVTAAFLRTLPDGAIFVNVARGKLLEAGALLAVGVKGRIRVALDVCEEGPMTLDLPTRKLPGAIVSPHLGGPTFDRFPQLASLALDNIGRYLRGEPLKAQVSLEAYDRAT